MGQKCSQLKVVAQVSVPAGPRRVDAITLSYASASWWRRGRKRVAKFTLRRTCECGEYHVGWENHGRISVCQEELRLPVAALQKKDGRTAVRVKCTWRGAKVFVTSMPLARLLALVEDAVKGDTALLHFRLAGEDGAFTALSCNGWRCGEECEGDAACPSHRESGGGALATPSKKQGPGLVEEGEAECPSHRESGGGAQASHPGLQGHGRVEEGESACPSHWEGGEGMRASPSGEEKPGGVEQGQAKSPSHWEGGRGTQASPAHGLMDTDNDTKREHLDEGMPSFVRILTNSTWVVPDSQLRHPSCSAPCCGAVPEADLGDPSSLALLHDLYSEDDVKVQPCSFDLGDPSSVTLLHDLYTKDDVKTQPSSVDLGDPSSLILLHDLYSEDDGNAQPSSTEARGAVSAIDGNPSSSLQADEPVPVRDTKAPSHSAQGRATERGLQPDATAPARSTRSHWMRDAVDVGALLAAVVATVLVLRDVWEW